MHFRPIGTFVTTEDGEIITDAEIITDDMVNQQIGMPTMIEQSTIVTQIQQNQRTITVQGSTVGQTTPLELNDGTVIHQVMTPIIRQDQAMVHQQQIQVPTMVPVTMLSLIQTERGK